MPRLATLVPAFLAFGSLALGSLTLGSLAPAAFAQQPDAEVPRPTRTFALENARVVVSPGRVLERATVLVRNGLIEAVGTNVRVPFDATRIAADSFTVYAGFVDGLGQVGFARPTPETNLPRVPDPANPPRDRAGLQPERRASGMLKLDDASIEAHRKAGFGAVHTVPHGGFMPGQGALVLLAGRTPEALVLRDEASMFAQFQNARGVYPGTPMAIMASWRTLYREAQRRGTLGEQYTRGPQGRERVVVDPTYEAFTPVIAGETPVFFYVKTALETYRALRLQEELGFKLVLAGLPDATEMPERLKAARVPLLLTLNLPDEPKKDSANATYSPALRARTYAEVSAEQTNLLARQRDSRVAAASTAGRLHADGLRFGFTTLGAKPTDVQKNVRRMVAAGLPEDAALAALTTDAAEIVGASAQLGTVEAGKIANLVVTQGSYFSEKGAVRYVFVDGERFSYPAAARPVAARRDSSGAPVGGAAAATAASPVGAWTYEVETPQGASGGVLTITGDAGALAGTISNDQIPGGSSPLRDVTLDGASLSFGFDAPGMGAITASVVLDGSSFRGTLDIPGLGGIPITGTRRPN